MYLCKNKVKKSLIGLACVALLMQATYVYALDTQFTTSQRIVTVDTGAPTIPVNVVATVVSSDQIDVSWNPSTDDVGVAGYQLFRDGAQIATTTSTTYIDTGLLPATTYAYTVKAFDAIPNVSTSSATTTATTNALPVSVPTTTPEVHKKLGSRSGMDGFKVVVTRTTAQFSWHTAAPTLSVVSWGRTHEYEMASLEERARFSDHSTQLMGLEPNTTYFFRIVARYGDGIEVVLQEGSFITEGLPDTEAPANVSGLRARQENTDVVLSWKDPTESDFDHVRIVRKENGYPNDPSDGVIVFEGKASEFRDERIFTQGSVYGYGVFAYDRIGNESSGAVVRIAKAGTPLPQGEEVIAEEGSFTVGLAPLQFSDVQFFENGHAISFIGNEVPLSGQSSFTIRIPYQRLPEHLKTVLVTLTDARNAELTFSFLLRVNRDKTAYEAAIAPLNHEGRYAVAVAVFDYKERTISKVSGALQVAPSISSPETSVSGGVTGFFKYVFEQTGYWSIVSILFAFLLILYGVIRRKEALSVAGIPGITPQ